MFLLLVVCFPVVVKGDLSLLEICLFYPGGLSKWKMRKVCTIPTKGYSNGGGRQGRREHVKPLVFAPSPLPLPPPSLHDIPFPQLGVAGTADFTGEGFLSGALLRGTTLSPRSGSEVDPTWGAYEPGLCGF